MITYRINEKLDYDEYCDFLKRSDLGSQYPSENFEERISKMLKNHSVAITARSDSNLLIGVCIGLTDFSYFLFLTDLGIDRDYEKMGIGKELVERIQRESGGKDDISVIALSNEDAVGFYKKCGYKPDSDLLWKPCGVFTDHLVE